MVAPHVQPAASAWARAHLTRGSSGGQVWEISSEYPEARLTVGVDPSAGWQIDAHGVHPVHCELFWDGQALWVADTQQVGGVFLDGMRVSDWVQIQGPSELRFGQAAMDIETSVPANQRMVASPQHAKPVTVTDMVSPPDRGRHSSPQFGGAAGDHSVPDLESEKTRMQIPSPLVDDARTHFSLPNPEEPPGMDLRPRLGGAIGAPQVDPHHAEATRMVPIPVAPVAAGPPKIGTPLGAPMPPPMVPLAGPPAAVVAPPPRAPAPPPPSPPPVALGAPEPLAPPPPPIAPVGPQGFAAPPPPAQGDQQKANPLGKVWEAIKPEKPEVDGKQAMPTRTWILLGVTVAVTVGWLLWDDTPEEVAAPPRPAQTATVTPPEPTPPEPTPTVEPTVEPTIEPTVDPAVDPTVAGDPTPVAADPAPSNPPEAASDTGEDGPTLQRRAVDAYRAGDYAAGLAAYRQLVTRYPDEASYPAMVRILERRIAEHEER